MIEEFEQIVLLRPSRLLPRRLLQSIEDSSLHLEIGFDVPVRGLPTASVLMSLCASAKRHGLNPWLYLTDTLNQLADKPADVNHLLPDVWAKRHGTIDQPTRG